MDDLLHGNIRITLTDADAIRGMERTKAAVKRGLKEIDRQKATVRIEADVREAERKIKQYERHMARLKGLQAEGKLGLDDKQFQARLQLVQARLDSMKGRKATLEIKLDKDREALRSLQNVQRELEKTQALEEKLQAAVEKAASAERRAADARERAAQQSGRVEAQAHRMEAQRQADIAKRAQAEGRMHAQAMNMMESEFAAREKGARDEIVLRLRAERLMEQDFAKREQASNRERMANISQQAEVAKLQQEYIKASQAVERLAQKRQKLIGGKFREAVSPEIHQRVDIQQARAEGEMAILRAKLEAMGEKPIEIPVRAEGSNILAKVGGLGDIGTRLGPFSGTLAEFTKASLVLGPVLTGLVGTVVALAGAIGGGLVGALGLGGAAAAGFGATFGGVFLALKPITTQFKEINKASNAYHVALHKYGPDSKEATKALGAFNHTMKDLSPHARQAFMELGGLNSRWKELTHSSRVSGMETMAEGVRTVSDLMPQFATRTNAATVSLSKGVTSWLRGIRSVEGRSTIDHIMGNVNQAIPPLMASLGHLGAAFGRTVSAFSDHFPKLIGDFDHWTAGIDRATQNTNSMNTGVGHLVQSFTDVLGVSMAFGRVIQQLGRAALGPGGNMMGDMADGLNQMADSMSTVSGQRKLSDFFSESIDTTTRLYNALKPLVELFFQFSTIMRPMTDALLSLIGPMGGLVHWFTSLKGVAPILQGLAAAFLFRRGAAAVVDALAGSVNGLAAAMRALGKAEAAESLSKFGSGLNRRAAGTAAATVEAETAAAAAARTASTAEHAVTPGGVILPGGVTRAAPVVEEAATVGKMAKAGAAADALSMGLLGVSAPVAGLGIAAIGAGLGLKKLIDHTNDVDRRRDKVAATFGPDARRDIAPAARPGVRPTGGRGASAAAAYQMPRGNLEEYEKFLKVIDSVNVAEQRASVIERGMADSYAQVRNARIGVKQAEDAYKTAVKDSGKNSDEARNALLQLTDARRQETAASATWAAQSAQGSRMVAQAVREAQAGFNAAKGTGAEDEMGRKLQQAKDAASAYEINMKRAMSGTSALTGQAAEKVGHFSQAVGKMPGFKRLLINVESQAAVTKIADVGNKLIAMGHKNTVTKILADAKNPEDAIKRLNNMLDLYARRQPVAHLRAEKSDAQQKLDTINALLKRYRDTPYEAHLRAEKRQAQQTLDSVNRQMNDLDGKEIKPHINLAVKMTDFSTSPTKSLGKLPGGGDGLGDGIGAKLRQGAQGYADENRDKFAKRMLSSPVAGLGNQKAAGSGLNAFNGLATKFGLSVGSGTRPGAVTVSGNTSYHAMGRARDFPGSPTDMMRFAKYMAATFGRNLKELIYTPLGRGQIKDGHPFVYTGAVAADHFDHVHVAMANGGRMDPKPGRYTQPQVLFAEEPGHPEYFISTNPRDKKRSQSLVLQAAQELDVQAFKTGGSRGNGYSIANIRKHGGTLSAEQVAILARAAGFKGRGLVDAIAIAFAESAFKVHASSHNPSGGTNMGLWQVDSGSHKDATYDPLGNAKAAYRISNGGTNWNPWETHHPSDKQGYGKYTGFLKEARRVAILSRKITASGSTNKSGSAAKLPAYHEAPSLGDRTTDAANLTSAEARLTAASVDPDDAQAVIDAILGSSRQVKVSPAERARRQRSAKRAQHAANKFHLDSGMSGAAGEAANALDATAKRLTDKSKLKTDTVKTPGVMDALNASINDDQKRLNTVNRALAKPLTHAKRTSLLQEREQLISSITGNKATVTERQTTLANAQFETSRGPDGNRAAIDYNTALAEGTTGTDDDLKYATADRDYWQARKDWADKRGDKAGATEAIKNLNAANDKIKQINDDADSQRKQALIDTRTLAENSLAATDALAALTVGLDDDLAGANKAVTYWRGELASAATDEDKTRAATGLASATSRVDDIKKNMTFLPLERERALASLTDTTTDDVTATTKLRDAWQIRLNDLQKNGGSDADIIEAAGNLKSLNDELKQVSGTVNQQMMSLGTQRYDLFSSMGSNFSNIWNQPSAAAAMSSGTSVTVNNTFPTPPPDPHTWSRGVAWELQAAV